MLFGGLTGLLKSRIFHGGNTLTFY